MAGDISLRAEWEDLLGRRPAFRDALGLYGRVLEAWERWTPSAVGALRWGPDECRKRWERGVSLIREAPPIFEHDALEPILGPVLDALAALGESEAEALGRLAAAWDEGRLTPAALLRGVPNGAESPPALALGIPVDLLGLVTYLGLRPPVTAYFQEARAAFAEALWDAGECPFCAAPPAFADIEEDGKRRLSCALCGGRWGIGRLRCPFCGNREARALTHLAGEGAEEGYLIEACEACRGYLKGVDRRVRWNAASALIEDWGTPHLDLFARRRGYWRPTPGLVQLAGV